MTATGWPDPTPTGDAAVVEPLDIADAPETLAAAVAGTSDSEGRRRLGRALRILLAARRRDDGGAGHINDN